MSISIDMARKILEACKQRARELRSPVSIAIVDAGGHLVLFERMMSPYGWATGNISIAKASTAVMFNQSTDAVAQWGSGIPGFASSMATMTEGKFIMAAGGWPLRVGGATIGGIGVSGGNAPGRDDEIARAGLGVLESALPPVPAQPPMSAEPIPQAMPPMQPIPSYSGPIPTPPMQSVPSYASPISPPPMQSIPSYSGPIPTPAPVASLADNVKPPSEVPSTQHLPEQDDPYGGDSYSQFSQDRPGGQS